MQLVVVMAVSAAVKAATTTLTRMSVRRLGIFILLHLLSLFFCIGLSRTSFFCPCPSAFVRCPSQVPLPFGRGSCLASDLRSSEG